MKLLLIARLFAFILAVLGLQVQAANTPESLAKLPPPGVQSLIEQVRAAAPNQELLQKYKQIYATEIPANASLSKRAEMLKERAVVAEELGELKQKLADLKQIADLYRTDGDLRKLAGALIDLSIAEVVYGDTSAGEAACLEVLQITNRINGLNGAELLALASLTNIATAKGNFDEAASSCAARAS